MNSRVKLLLAAAAALSLPACERQERHESAAAQTDAAAEERAIRGQVDRWLQLIKAKDAAAIAQLYTEDGSVMAPNMPIGTGHAAIEKVWADMLSTPGVDLTFAPQQIIVSSSGDMALDRGAYRFTMAGAQGSQTDTGKYVVVWRKIGGEWKAAADIFNSDVPAAGA